MKVFVDLHDGHRTGVAVERSITGFDFIELCDGISDGISDYRVAAKRKGFESKRMNYRVTVETYGYLYPEIREMKREDSEAEFARIRDQTRRRTLERKTNRI